MRSFSLNELKRELLSLPATEVADLCVALAKYKKDNKDFLGYLLVDAYNKPGFITDVKKEMDQNFLELKTQTNLYYTKKSLRKILRILTRYCRFMNDKAASADLHLYFCRKIKESGIAIEKSQQLQNMYDQQLKKIKVMIASLHEDLQHDFFHEIEELS